MSAAAAGLLWPIRALALEICWDANEPPLAQAWPGMNVAAMLTVTNMGERAIDAARARAAALGGTRQPADGIAKNHAVG